jgi:hypothetical protein
MAQRRYSPDSAARDNSVSPNQRFTRVGELFTRGSHLLQAVPTELLFALSLFEHVATSRKAGIQLHVW